MYAANINSKQIFEIDQVYMKPIFTQPSVYKMAEHEMDIVSDYDMNMDEQVCQMSVFFEAPKQTYKIDQKLSVYECQDICQNFVSVQSTQESIDMIDNTKDTIAELPAIIPVTRGIWRSITRSSKIVFIEEVESENLNERVSEKQIVEESEEDEIEDIEAAIAKMNDLIDGQITSIDLKLPCVIRESAELRRNIKEQVEPVSNHEGDDEYEKLKAEVLSLIRQKIDKIHYRSSIKSSRYAAINAMEDWHIGDSRRSLKIALKKAQ